MRNTQKIFWIIFWCQAMEQFGCGAECPNMNCLKKNIIFYKVWGHRRALKFTRGLWWWLFWLFIYSFVFAERNVGVYEYVDMYGEG